MWAVVHRILACVYVVGGVGHGERVSVGACVGARAKRALVDRLGGSGSALLIRGSARLFVTSDGRCMIVSSGTLRCVVDGLSGSSAAGALALTGALGASCGVVCGRAGPRALSALSRLLSVAGSGIAGLIGELGGLSVLTCVMSAGSNRCRGYCLVGPSLIEGEGSLGGRLLRVFSSLAVGGGWDAPIV